MNQITTDLDVETLALGISKTRVLSYYDTTVKTKELGLFVEKAFTQDFSSSILEPYHEKICLRQFATR